MTDEERASKHKEVGKKDTPCPEFILTQNK